ncbi:MAG: glycosyltransferase family A protein [Bacteroidota bacterium]
MFFTLIIPTFNRAHLIHKTLLSILNQKFKDYEVIIIDDGSTDDTQFVIEHFIQHNNLLNWHYYYQKNRERGAARNYGIAKANGEWITFLDSDDRLYPSHFETAYEFISVYSSIDVFHSAYVFNNDLGEIKKSVIYPKNKDLNAEILKGNILSCFGMFVRKEVLRNYNFCEERALSGTEDWLLWLQLSARYKIHLQSKITGSMILHSERSVLGFNNLQMLNRSNLLIKYLNKDAEFLLKYGQRAIDKIHAHMMTYIALHMVISGQKQTSIKYFVKGIIMNVNEIFSRRTLAFFKYLFIKRRI